MRIDCYAAIDMGHNEVAFIISASHFARMLSGHGFLIQHMKLCISVYAFDSCQPCDIRKLIHIGRIKCIGRFAIIVSQFIGQHNPQLRRMITAADRIHCVLVKQRIHDGNPFML